MQFHLVSLGFSCQADVFTGYYYCSSDTFLLSKKMVFKIPNVAAGCLESMRC